MLHLNVKPLHRYVTLLLTLAAGLGGFIGARAIVLHLTAIQPDPFEKAMLEAIENRGLTEAVERQTASLSYDEGVQYGIELSSRGIARLSLNRLQQWAQLKLEIMKLGTMLLCADNQAVQMEELRSAILQLDGISFAEWVDLSAEAMGLEMYGTIARFAPSESEVDAAILSIGDHLTAPDRDRYWQLIAATETASPGDICWLEIALVQGALDAILSDSGHALRVIAVFQEQ